MCDGGRKGSDVFFPPKISEMREVRRVVSCPCSHTVFGVLAVLDLRRWVRYGCRHILGWEQQHRNFDCCVGVVLLLPLHFLLLSLLLTIQHKGIIVVSLTFASWRHDQSYRWCFAPLRSSMWLIHIDEKGWLLLARYCVLVGINRRRCRRGLLQHDVGHHHRVDDIIVPQSSLAPAMRHRGLDGCCLARSRVPSLQSTVIRCHSLQYKIKR